MTQMPGRAILTLTEADVRRKGQQTGSVRFRSGAWSIRYSEWRFVDGEWDWRDTERKIEDGGKKLTEKRALMLGYEQWVSKANQLNKTPQGHMDLATFVEVRYQPDVVSSYGRTWRASAETILRKHIVPAFGRLQITEVRPDMVQEWVNRKAREVSSKYTKELLTQLRGIMAHAAAMGITSPNLAGIRLPRPVSEERVAYSLDLIRQLASKLVSANHPEWARFTLFLALTGLRRGEALALRWQDLDLERGSAQVRGTWDLKGLTPGKSKAALRLVPLDPEAVAIARAQREMSKWLAPENSVWAQQPTGRPMRADNGLKRIVKPIAAEMGMVEFEWHGLRHRFVTDAAQRLNQRELQAVSGHSSAAISLRYQHPDFDEMKRKLEGKPN